ncbi:conserved exported hypothetical protein [Candidatus Zixiibacteriota bacterium]|nr:conserved exported hypothetical protein [candidate division Zixibacteria bacterium]
MKHIGIITIFLAIFLVSSIFASEVNTITAEKASVNNDKIVVPLSLKNVQTMTALDLPLKFSKGVTLEEVTFEGTRSADFDFKYGAIHNDINTVIIGMIPMMYGVKPDLAPGDGVIANLVFRVDDPTIKSIDLSVNTETSPDHSPMFVYSGPKGEVEYMVPEFSGFSVALVAGADKPLPTEFALRQNAPNPFNPSTAIVYDLPKATNVHLEIYNVLGQKVKTLVDEYQNAGTQIVIWDGYDQSGASVASGVYFYRISAGDFNATKKMMMLK